MHLTREDIIDLLGAVSADLDDVASRLRHAPQGLDPLAAASLELQSVTVDSDGFSRQVAMVNASIAAAIKSLVTG